MSIRRIAQSIAGILILAPSTQAFASGAGCDPQRPARTARLVIENTTVCDVAIYVDGSFAGVCPALMTLPLQTRMTGTIRLMGRSRCDVWGPYTLTLAAGKTVRWRIGYEVPPDADPSTAHSVEREATHTMQSATTKTRRHRGEPRPGSILDDADRAPYSRSARKERIA